MRFLLRKFLKFIIGFLFSVKVNGDLNEFKQDNLLIVANHESFLDGLLLGLYLPIDPVFLVHTTVTKKWYFRLILSQVDYLEVDSTSPMAVKHLIRLVESGRPVAVFPEGRISTTGSLMKIYDGPGLVAARTGANIVPVRINGTGKSYFSHHKGRYPRQLFPRITISILPTEKIAMPDVHTSKLMRQRHHAEGESMRRIMQKMIFESLPKQTLWQSLCSSVEDFGYKYKLIEDIKQVEYSYFDFLKMAIMLTKLVLRAAPNTASGESIGVLLPNMAPSLALTLGLSAKGHPPAMLNYTAGADALQSACTSAGVRTIVSSRAFVEQAKLAEKIAKIQNTQILYLEDLRPLVTLWDKVWLMAYGIWAIRSFEIAGATPESAAAVLFTSGSEGKPKGVVLSHRAILANIGQILGVIDLSPNDKILNALPIFHSFGLTAGALLPVLNGASLFLYPTPLHYRVIPEISYDRSCTVIFGTSTFLGNYGKYAHPYDFHKLRYAVAGAEKLSDSVKALWFEKFGVRIIEGYGATETAPVLAVNTPMAFKSGTVGQFLPGIEYKLVKIAGIENGGALHVKGPNVMSGYLYSDNPRVLNEPSSEVGKGWYETGDIVEVDSQGFVKVVGRIKRFAKIAGEMISLESVEILAAAASGNQEKEHAASSQHDESKGEALVLFTTDDSLNRQSLQKKATELGYTELSVPRKIVYLEKLPLLGTGKIDYVQLKKMAESA